jgi:hypothetical protein
MTKKKETKTKKKSAKESKIKTDDINEFDLLDNKIVNKNDEIEEEHKIQRISHFDILNNMFINWKEFDSYTSTVFEQNFFMLNRTLSIKYPMQAAYFNKMNINQKETVKFWKYFLNAKEGTGRVPQFVYTKGAKRTTDEDISENSKPDPKAVIEYCKRYNLSKHDFEDMMSFFRNDTIEDLKRFEKLNSKSEQAKMFKTVKSSDSSDDE